MPNRPALHHLLAPTLAALLAGGVRAEAPAPFAPSAPVGSASAAAGTCADCGRVLSVRELTPPNGSFAARAMERRLGAHKGWVVDVQYDRGEVMHYVFPQEPAFKVGETVRPQGSGIARQ